MCFGETAKGSAYGASMEDKEGKGIKDDLEVSTQAAEKSEVGAGGTNFMCLLDILLNGDVK